eukprot:3746284-Pyramimonas_sp.AAC.2
MACAPGSPDRLRRSASAPPIWPRNVLMGQLDAVVSRRFLGGPEERGRGDLQVFLRNLGRSHSEPTLELSKNMSVRDGGDV